MTTTLDEALRRAFCAAGASAVTLSSHAVEKAVKAALASLARDGFLLQQGWQPIETAPKVGRDLILLMTPSGFPQVAYSNTWRQAGFSVECKPTHWMPLPAAPKLVPQ